MCPRHITRKFYICLFGIVQANNKVYFNFLFSVVPFIEIIPLGTLWEGAMLLEWDSNVPVPICRRLTPNITKILPLFLKHHFPFEDIAIYMFSRFEGCT